MRKANEVLISPEVLQQMLSEAGGSRVLSVVAGPAAEASIVGARWDAPFGSPTLVLVYDRDVPEPTLRLEAELEQKLVEQARYVVQLEAALEKANNDHCGCLGFVGVIAEA